MSTVERKYAYTKIEAGDYILPLNDARTLWRIYLSSEIGGSEDNVEWDWTPAGWYVSKYIHSLTAGSTVSLDDWSCWDSWSGPYQSRDEAVRDVLR